MYEHGPHCTGCNQQCKITIGTVTYVMIGDQKIRHTEKRGMDESVLYGLKIANNLCANRGKNTPEQKHFELSTNIHCDKCDKKCLITYNPEKNNWVSIGEKTTPGTHATKYDALLHGLKICKLCRHRTK